LTAGGPEITITVMRSDMRRDARESRKRILDRAVQGPPGGGYLGGTSAAELESSPGGRHHWM